MQTAIDVTQVVKAKEQAAQEHVRKRDLIKLCIEVNADDNDIWLTYTEIAICTGMRRKEVIRVMYGCGSFFLQSNWRRRNGEILVTIRELYEKRTSFLEKMMAAFTGQGD